MVGPRTPDRGGWSDSSPRGVERRRTALLFASNGRARPHSTRERLINRAVAKGARFIAQTHPSATE